jgi:hypothetical protein
VSEEEIAGIFPKEALSPGGDSFLFRLSASSSAVGADFSSLSASGASGEESLVLFRKEPLSRGGELFLLRVATMVVLIIQCFFPQ